MQICNYFKGATDKLSGFVYDVAAKEYKTFSLKADEWSDGKGYYKPGGKLPGDIDYFFPTYNAMMLQLAKIKDLGFTENKNIQLDFGTFIL